VVLKRCIPILRSIDTPQGAAKIINNEKTSLVIFAYSNILSDMIDCALACNLIPSKIFIDRREPSGY